METKPGVYTTEFWVTILLQVLFALNTVEIWTFMPQRWSGLVQAIIAAAYLVSRGLAKQGVGADPTVPGNYKLVPKQRDMVRR